MGFPAIAGYLYCCDLFVSLEIKMRRRDFLAAFGGAAAAWPLAARTQQSYPMRRIGVLTTIFSENDSEASAWLAAFQDELQKLGWQQGRNITFETRLIGNDVQRLASSS